MSQRKKIETHFEIFLYTKDDNNYNEKDNKMKPGWEFVVGV